MDRRREGRTSAFDARWDPGTNWHQLGFKFSDVAGAADLDFGSDGHFNDLEDTVNPLQKSGQ